MVTPPDGRARVQQISALLEGNLPLTLRQRIGTTLDKQERIELRERELQPLDPLDPQLPRDPRDLAIPATRGIPAATRTCRQARPDRTARWSARS